ncbi:MAG: monovalent cation/H(+) antiporter subunit G [Planctomycetota bacterium]
MTLVWDIVTVVLVLVGAFFATLAGVGIIRMPDLYMRMQSATKAGTLGVACLAAAAAAHFRTSSVLIEVSLVILFLFATAPVASHLIARAAFGAGTPLWDRTSRDDDAESHADAESEPTG